MYACIFLLAVQNLYYFIHVYSKTIAHFQFQMLTVIHYRQRVTEGVWSNDVADVGLSV